MVVLGKWPRQRQFSDGGSDSTGIVFAADAVPALSCGAGVADSLLRAVVNASNERPMESTDTNNARTDSTNVINPRCLPALWCGLPEAAELASVVCVTDPPFNLAC